jgi:hypothetical protein
MPKVDADVLLSILPDELRCILHESFLLELSEIFSELSHQSSPLSFDVGETLLALYLVLYPRFYPQIGKILSPVIGTSHDQLLIGLHLLEMAKVAWNVLVVSDLNLSDPEIGRCWERAGKYLHMATQVLNVLGNEGDDGGPLAELEALSRLRSEEQARVRSAS